MPSIEECANTNPWAALFLADAQQKAEQRKKAASKARKTLEYKLAKPACITAFEAEIFRTNGQRVTYEDQTANGLTRFVIDWLRWRDHYAARINLGGIHIDGDRYRTSGATKGVADIISCIGGLFVQWEVKAGKDRPRDTQLEQQRLTIAAGGQYHFIHNAQEFIDKYNEIQWQR